ncbi:hypothetical protein CBM2599_B51430 [Cupriavidus taiwanensis]|nr:hypothetical protein CBM2599_B51430 [Cupriavidus taiwanensis]
MRADESGWHHGAARASAGLCRDVPLAGADHRGPGRLATPARLKAVAMHGSGRARAPQCMHRVRQCGSLFPVYMRVIP